MVISDDPLGKVSIISTVLIVVNAELKTLTISIKIVTRVFF